MALSRSMSSCLAEDDFSCSVCCEVFVDPVVLACSHSFCDGCLKKWWRQKRARECPLCKRRHAKNAPLVANLALRAVCEAFVREQRRRDIVCGAGGRGAADGGIGGTLLKCALHAESLGLFCRDCRTAVCVVCLYSERHARHSFRPVGEVGEKVPPPPTSAAATTQQPMRPGGAEEARRGGGGKQLQRQQQSYASCCCSALLAFLALCFTVFIWLNYYY